MKPEGTEHGVRSHLESVSGIWNLLVNAGVPSDARGRCERNGIGGEVRHGVTSGVSRETSLNKHVTPHLHWE